MANSSSSATWRPVQQGQAPAASQGPLAASEGSFPTRGEPSESHLLMSTYNIGCPEGHSHTSQKTHEPIKDKLKLEMQYLCDRFHAIFIQEVALNWSMILAHLLPTG